MAQRHSQEAASPSASSIRLPIVGRSRRGSLASLSSRSQVDKEALASALDQIHNTASRSETLTTFDEFASPPRSTTSGDGKGLAGDLVHGGLSGLYSKIRASVSGARDAVVRPTSAHGNDSLDELSVSASRAKPAPKSTKSSAGTLVSSPVVVSTSSSRLQSPLIAHFPDNHLASPRSTDSSAISIASKASIPTPKVPPIAQTRAGYVTAGHHDRTPSIDVDGISKDPKDGPPAEVALKSPRSSISYSGTQSVIPTPKAAATARDKSPDLPGSGVVQQPILQQLNHALAAPADHMNDPVDRGSLHSDRHEILEDDDQPISPRSSGTIHVPNQPMSTAMTAASIDGTLATQAIKAIPGDSESTSTQPSLLQVSQSHLPGYGPSRATSSDGDLSSVVTVAPTRPITFELPERHREAKGRNSEVLSRNRRPQKGRQLLGKEFWMRDENAKDCFNCGNTFSTFRRKHHCRTCGQIFDAKCTSLIPGRQFGQAGSLRVCKPCEAIIFGNDEDSSDFSEEEASYPLVDPSNVAKVAVTAQPISDVAAPQGANLVRTSSGFTEIGTPTMGIPMSRKAGESKRRSAIIEFEGQHTLTRPSSSRSLRSLSGRPRSSSHKRHPSRHQHMRSLKSSVDDRAPFQLHEAENASKRSTLPAFHHDSIIDPDLAPFMSDEGSSEEEQASIFATLNADATPAAKESERSGLGSFLAAVTKGRSRTGDKSAFSTSGQGRDLNYLGGASKQLPRPPRVRNLSVSSVVPTGASPRKSKSNSLLIGAPIPISESGAVDGDAAPDLGVTSGGVSKVIRSASMCGADAPVVELNRASLQHVRKMLKQMLQDARVQHVKNWEKALIPILLQSTDDVTPNVQRNDDMDIRHYVKLKKIPGGKPGDTSYISGVVFTKNVALKSMPRSISQPRIAIVTFAIEYARHQQHFMSLEPVIAQEREYLKNLVRRITALQPHVLLVQRNVSGLALQFLAEANVAVIYNVKPSVLNAVSRCTQTRLITSVDRLTTDPSHLGKCSSFDVKTYVHNGIRKTYIYLSGCQPDLGCTVVLRGAERETLKRVKRITEFMCYVVYNLKLETSLMRDEFVLIPTNTNDDTLSSGKETAQKAAKAPQAESTAPLDAITQASQRLQEHVHRNLERADAPEEIPNDNASKSLLDADATPQQAGNVDSTYDGTHVPDDVPMPSFYSDMVEKHRTKILSASPFVKYMQPYLLMKAREQERRLAHLKRLRDQYSPQAAEVDSEKTSSRFEIIKPEMVHGVVKKASKQVRDFLYAVHNAEYDKALHNYLTQKRQWEAYIAGNIGLFDPLTHQKIAVLYSLVNSVTSTPCTGPEIIALGFYNEHELEEGFAADTTLGQYVEDLCHSAHSTCDANGCNRKLFDHHRQYVHGEGQMSVMVQKYPSKIRGLHKTILMWSCCRICAQETQVIPMSENTWKYSFGKYLELTFWSTNLHPRASVCPHDIHRDHIRYFGFNNVALRIQYDAIQLYEVIVPRPTITWKVDSELKLKNDQFTRIKDRLDKFMLSVKSRIKTIHAESVIPEKMEACKAELEKLTKRATDEHEFLLRKLQEKYAKSRYYEIIPLNRAVRAIQERAIAWDETFVEFERNFFPSEKDISRLAALQLRKLFLDRDESTASIPSIEEESEDVQMETEKAQADSDEPLQSLSREMSQEEAHDVLTSVVTEQCNSDTEPPETHRRDHVSDAELLDLQPKTADAEPSPYSATVLEAVEREDVKHLDLAVSSDLLETVTAQPAVTPEPERTDSAVATGPTASSEPGPLQPAPLDPSITRTIAQMRSVAAAEPQTLDGISESKIPRPTDISRRESTITPAPLSRTQSQPADIPQVDKVGISTPPTITRAASIATAKADTTRLSMSEAARALEKRMSERFGQNTIKSVRSSSQSLIPRSVLSKRNESRVSTLAKHFEQLSREFEKERLRERRQRAARGRQYRAHPLASSKPIVEVYQDVHEAVQQHDPSEEETQTDTPGRLSTDTSNLADSTAMDTTAPTTAEHSPVTDRHEEREGMRHSDADRNTKETTPSVEGETKAPEHAGSDDEDAIEGIEDDQTPFSEDIPLDLALELPKHEKTSLMKMLTSFWSERSASGWTPLDYPLTPIEHVWEDSDIIVREDEPSSIIALALSCPDYLAKLQQFRDPPPSRKRTSQAGTYPQEDVEASIERNLLYQKNTNIRYTFLNHGVKAQCKILYAQSFDALRRKCGVADRFVESLSRCLKWDSKGGKSKSLFLRTLDDRFVLKSLSEVEVKAFNNFAPNYFAFMHQNLFKGLPSVIAKMLGLFQVTFKSPASGVEYNWFMLVMENLFYDREPNRRFDLKGSMRNRKIQSTGERDEVLLDENLVDIIFEKPIFVREHTKKLLKASVWNDTLFLSKQNVMDYSLMAGFDDTRQEIIVGIIDCIRTYTWDKKLETWIKDRGKNKPTITSPRDYRMRFRFAMSTYILQAPNCWHQFQTQSIQKRPLTVGVKAGREEQEPEEMEGQVAAGPAL